MQTWTQDTTRQTVVIASATFMLIAAAVGSGAFGGTSVNELQDGALSAQGSYLAPAGPAFSIWSVIYIGLIAYTVWQALPAQRIDERQREVGPWIAASMVMNGLWLITAQFLSLIMTVIVIAILLAILARVIVLLGHHRPRSWVERVVVDAANGLHFGWVTIATVANTAAWLTQIGPDSWEQHAGLWSVVVLVVVLMIGVASAWLTGRFVPALATAWGLAWVAVGRVFGEPESILTAVMAILVAVVLVIAAIVASIPRHRAGARRSARVQSAAYGGQRTSR